LAFNKAHHPDEWLYASSVGFNPRWLKVQQNGMSSQATDQAVVFCVRTASRDWSVGCWCVAAISKSEIKS